MKKMLLIIPIIFLVSSKALITARVPNHFIVDIEVEEDDLRGGSNLDCILFFEDGTQSKEFNVNHGEGIQSRHFKSFTVPCSRECLDKNLAPKSVKSLQLNLKQQYPKNPNGYDNVDVSHVAIRYINRESGQADFYYPKYCFTADASLNSKRDNKLGRMKGPPKDTMPYIGKVYPCQ